ncbi:MAG: O-antigen polymerase [Actinomycetota bacterium]
MNGSVAGARRERLILPFGAVFAAGLLVVGLAAAFWGLDWRWLLLMLSAASVVLPCGFLALRGRLDVFEPLLWFALLFLLLFVLRPAWDLWHENFIYTSRLISPTFTKVIVAGLLAGTGFVIGYLTPPAGLLSSRLPSPPRLDPRRLLIWATLVMAVALVAFLIFFVSARGWRDPADFFFRGEGRLKHLLASPTATSKYFLASILLMVPVALFFLSIRHTVGGGARMGRIAGWAAGASILAFVVYNLAAGQRRYVVVMVGALALYHYLTRGRRPSARTLVVTALVALTVVSVVRDLRLAHAQPTDADPLQWLPWNAMDELFETQDTGVAPALATEMLVVPSELDYTYGKTTLLGPFITLVPRQLWEGKPAPADQEVLATVWGGTPCGYQGQCSTFSPFGEPYRDGGLVGVFLFALAFGALWKVAWLYYLRHRNSAVAIIAYSALLPFMISWMRANFTLQALQAAMVLAVVVLGAVLCRTRPGAAAPPPRTTIPVGSQ